jgi:formylglycine-generating enzyme required for sulfatase activity
MRRDLPLYELPYVWTKAWGDDEYGIWTAFEYRGVTQRLRWIPPGRFSMGSPDSESERLQDEVQHEVELTRGFWLADTVCTQELWDAVMGGNPSRFKGADRPVESVSWEDCREFFERINQAVPGLDSWLPTEAQWEYACRAGTATPFWFGNQVTPEQVNYNGNFPYNGGAKGEYREETVAVGSLPCNGWGLYEMHGNVWEWCSDWLGSYAKGKTVDPRGPDEGEARVLRGGSWIYGARRCRSARRFKFRPDAGFDRSGFRLCQGQTGRVQE